jgi:hypothetical protein
MKQLMIVSLMLGSVFLLLRQLQIRRFLAANVAGFSLMMVLTAVGMVLLPVYNPVDHPRDGRPQIFYDARVDLRWWQVAAQIGVARKRFSTFYPDATSNIDENVELDTYGDLIRYLPRAFLIGLGAPFPNMWFETGNSVGSMGRILSGVETALMYAVEGLGILGLWRGRQRLSVWLVLAIAVMGTTALGLVVVNVGTLYRLRYGFMILVVILAAGGGTYILDYIRKRSTLSAQAQQTAPENA